MQNMLPGVLSQPEYRCCVPLILALGKERQVCMSLRPAWFTHQVSGYQGYIRGLCPLQKLLHLFVGEQAKHVEVRITFRSLFSLSTTLRPVLNSDSQTWQQVPSTTEPSTCLLPPWFSTWLHTLCLCFSPMFTEAGEFHSSIFFSRKV